MLFYSSAQKSIRERTSLDLIVLQQQQGSPTYRRHLAGIMEYSCPLTIIYNRLAGGGDSMYIIVNRSRCCFPGRQAVAGATIYLRKGDWKWTRMT